VPNIEGHREEQTTKRSPRGESDSEKVRLKTLDTGFINTIKDNHELSKMGNKG
jgi:hypothetical protein